jgi:predicted MFS family arabinose efflux permease
VGDGSESEYDDVTSAEPDTGEARLAAADVEDAIADGDRTVRFGTAGAALRYPVFRRVLLGALLSNIGTWMQNVILGAYIFGQTHSSTYVGLISLAQLGPVLLLSLPAGSIADRFDRCTILIVVSIEQAVGALAIAWIVVSPHPPIDLLLAVVVAIGVGQAVYAPTFSALVPNLVARKDLSGAISLNSVNMNLSRVVGPAIGGVLFAHVGVSWVFVGNAGSYAFIVAALWTVRLPRPHIDRSLSRLRLMIDGIRFARRDRVVGRCLTTMVMFSFFCLPVAVLMPVVAQTNLGVNDRSSAYGYLYACFGAGAVAGALSIGTFLARRELSTVIRFALAGFAAALGSFALLREPAPAFPVVFMVGYFYFATVTSLATVLQRRLGDAVRGRVMALWVMAFGGTVPIGAIVGGWLSDVASVTAVLLGGAIAAVGLVLFANLAEDRHGGGSGPSVGP